MFNARLLLCATLLTVCQGWAGSIQYSVSDTSIMSDGNPVRRFNYTFSNITLNENEEIEIRFDPAYFVSVFNAIGPVPSFSVLALQVNNPPGAFGTFSILSLQNAPTLLGLFSIDAVLTGGPPTTLPFAINRIDPVTGAFQAQIDSGLANNVNAVPEPASFICVLAGGAALALWRNRRRRSLY